MANRLLNQFLFSFHKMPVIIDMKFVVASTDSAGKGITGLIGQGVKNVYMNTSQTPAGPVNPAAGYILIQLQDNYSQHFLTDWNAEPPVTGADINISGSSVLTVGVPYQITAVGTSTTANWAAVGLPPGVTPAVGQSFLATVTGSGTGTGTVKAIGIGGVASIETVPMVSAATIAPVGIVNQGAWIILKCLAATNASTTTLIASAPTAGAIISVRLSLSNASVRVAGQS